MRRTDSIADMAEYEQAGLEIFDHRQHLLVDTVSVSFFMPDQPLRTVLHSGVRTGPRLAGRDERFASKALVTANRSRTRAWFDLYHLMTTGGYSIEDFVRIYELHADPLRLAVALSRLCSGRPGLTDEGFVSLLPQPPTLDEMTHFLRLRVIATRRLTAPGGSLPTHEREADRSGRLSRLSSTKPMPCAQTQGACCPKRRK